MIRFLKNWQLLALKHYGIGLLMALVSTAFVTAVTGVSVDAQTSLGDGITLESLKKPSAKPTGKAPSAPTGSPAVQAKPNATLDNASTVPFTGTVTPFTAGVSISKYLPPAMYGQWSVTATLLETNEPDFFKAIVHDIWLLEQAGDQVSLSNPVTGAFATVNVDSVQGNTARFHRMVVSPRGERFIEVPTVTVDHDRLYGSTMNQIEIRRGRQILFGRYQLTAERIGQSKEQLKADNPLLNRSAEPDIEIEDMQIDLTPSKSQSW